MATQRLSQSVRNKIRQYIESATGQEKISEATAAAVSEQDMRAAANEMIRILQDLARSYDLPPSVQNHFSSLRSTGVQIDPTTGNHMVGIYFADDLHRDSLDLTRYEEGIDNIVALFNNGYAAHGYIYGFWRGHSPTALKWQDLAGYYSQTRGGDDGTFIRSLPQRFGLHFMNTAVDAFNTNYGQRFHCVAAENEIYKDND